MSEKSRIEREISSRQEWIEKNMEKARETGCDASYQVAYNANAVWREQIVQLQKQLETAKKGGV